MVTVAVIIALRRSSGKRADEYLPYLGIQPFNGPGTELKKLISWFPVPRKKNCRSCRSLEIKMNRWGAEKCLEKMDYICKKLAIAAKRRKLPYSRSLAEKLVRKAIRNATKETK